MRARRGVVVGVVAVALYGIALLWVAATTHDGQLGPGDRSDGEAASALVTAWQRSREATFVRIGAFERVSEVTGASIRSEDVLAQEPPRRLHRQLGGVEGRNDDRLILCPAGEPGTPNPRCEVGPPGDQSYAASVASEAAGLRSLVTGEHPVYGVRQDEDCFELAQLRSEPRAPFGIAATLCFDPVTGAPADSTVRYAGGIVERLRVTEIRARVTDADLRP
jgi:hypothetical protein